MLGPSVHSPRLFRVLGATLVAAGCTEPVPDVVRVEESEPAASEPLPSAGPWTELPFVHARGATGAFRLEEIMSGGVALIDLDGDADLDLFCVHGDPEAGSFGLFVNDGSGELSDVTERIDGRPEHFGMGAAAGDFDGDGWTDLFVTQVGPDLLLRNEAGERFVDFSRQVGLGDEGFGSSATWFDSDLDGDLDLYSARYIDRASPESPCRHLVTHERDYCNPLTYRPVSDRFWRNEGGRFADESERSGIAAQAGYGLAVLASDHDLDGRIDLFVANDQSPAFLWRNRGDARFEDVAPTLGFAYDRDGRAIAGMGLVAEDFDGDLDLDLFVTNIREQDNVFFRLEGGRYLDVSRRWGSGDWLLPNTGFGVAAWDRDHDGELELYVANGAVAKRLDAEGDDPYAEPDTLLRFDGGRFVDAGLAFAPDVARGVARGDLDGDGDLELVVARNGAAPRILWGEAPEERRWITVEVVDEAGRPVLNARVTIVAGGRSWVAETRAQESYLSSRDPRAHFGLGDAARVERLTVRFPDGHERELRDVEPDRVVVVRRGEAPR